MVLLARVCDALPTGLLTGIVKHMIPAFDYHLLIYDYCIYRTSKVFKFFFNSLDISFKIIS